MAEVTRGRVGHRVLLAPDGPLIEAERSAALLAAVEECVAERDGKVVIDLARAPLVNSEGLEALWSADDALTEIDGSLEIAHPGPLVRSALGLTGLSDRLSIEGDPVPDRERRRAANAERRIGEILRARDLVTEDQIEAALSLQRTSGQRMAAHLVDKGWIGEADLLDALSEQLGLPFVRLVPGLCDTAIVRCVESEVCRRLQVLPLFVLRGVVFLATADPQSLPALETVEDLTGYGVQPVLACTDEILDAIGHAFAAGSDLSEYLGDVGQDFEVVEAAAEDEAAIDELAAGSPVINLINGLIQRAIRDQASDIHIEPMRRTSRVRMRVDGILYTVMTPPADIHPALVSRLKVMAKLDIAERRLPQDGRIQVVTAGRTVDLRFSSLPGIFGEKIVLRVLDKNQSILQMDRLGLHEHTREQLETLLARSYGLLVVTGPTGSGKTTTLYAAMNRLNKQERNIVTIEDPVEYQIDGLSQNQVRDAIGLSFARVLKHVLRQDPDIIMVGEIRERETAEIAVHAALTGHLVLSTLHTNDSAGAITRMLDMGIEPFLLSSALVGVVAQRLVRRICEECRTTYVAPEEALLPFGVEVSGQTRLARGRGCSACYDSGYKDRIGIHEVLVGDAALQQLIISSPSRDALNAYVRDSGVRTLLRDGMERAIAGETTVEEVLRVVSQ